MSAPTAAPRCPGCGNPVPSAFVGRICPRCALASMVLTPEPEVVDGASGEPSEAVAPVNLKVGARFGDYELVDVLGRGGMAVVYLARQVSLDRLVALKVLDATPSGGQRHKAQERFRREARAVARLDHPGIVSVHDVGALPGALFYTMDHIEGDDLGRALRKRRFTVRESAALVQKLAEAMAYAHEHGVVHRDLKPGNVLLDHGGEPRIADFGIAHETQDPGHLTRTGDFLGTPLYMSPEMLAGGPGRAAPAGDLYALGAILFQMLTGRTPFVGDSPSEILQLALHTQPPAPRLLNPGIPRDLETICQKCLEKSPAARYRDADALAEDLGRFLGGEPILARPASAPMRAWRWARRRPALATVLAASMLGSVGATFAAISVNSARARAVRAEGAAREELWRANLAHAQAARRTTQAGARREALAALADAARFRPAMALRNEAIAALCLPEAEVAHSWPLALEWTAPMVFHPSLETYAAETAPGLLVLRRCLDQGEVARLEVPGKKVSGIPVFSPDGRLLAARYADNAVRVWDVAAGRVLFWLTGRPSPMDPPIANYAFDLAFRPDGGQLAVGGPVNGFTLHAMPGGEEQGRWAGTARATILRFSPDGRRLAVVERNAPAVQFVNVPSLAPGHSVPLSSVPVSAAWEPGGDKLALGTRAGRIHRVTAATGEISDTFPVLESGGIGQVVPHPGRPFLAGLGADEALRFWDAHTGRLMLRLDAVNNRPVMTFDRTGTWLGVYDASAKRASLVAVQPSPILETAPPARPLRSAISTGAFDASRDGRWLVSSAHGSVQLRDARTGQPWQTLRGADPNGMMTAQFAPDARALLVNDAAEGLRRHAIVVPDDGDAPPTLGAAEPLDAEPGFTLQQVADDGRALLINEATGTVKVVDPAHPAATRRWPVAKVGDAVFTPDGRRVLTQAGETVPGEPAVQVWDAVTGQRVAAFGDDPGGRVGCSRAGGWVVVTGEKSTQLWRLDAWTRGPELPAELQGETQHARLSDDGALLAIEKGGGIHLVSTATGQPVALCEAPGAAGVCVNPMFSADGTRLALLWQYGSVHVWDLAAMRRELAAIGLDWEDGKRR